MRKNSPQVRRTKIQELLSREGRLSMTSVQAELGVSAMTASRDAQALVESGMARRVWGGLALPENTDKKACALCQGAVPLRTRFILPRASHLELACCPHCGLALVLRDNISGAMAVDFLYGSVIQASQAYYLAESVVRLCCAPSLLSFFNPEDGARFARGFGGTLYDYAGVTEYMRGITR
jgi:DeoR family transcriptional regulator, copper-sensing transcriptional repressor